jgi:8-oxo-dGTP pyrophosphatase MutT (NUDIX family)
MEYRSLDSCGALIYAPNTKRYLFLLRANGKHARSWGLPGGKIEPNETVIEGLYREIIEELNVDLRNNKVIPIEKFTNDSMNFSYHTFVIKVDQEFIPELNSEHTGYCWTPLTQYPKPLHPGVWRSFQFEVVIDKLKTLESIL